MNKKHQIIILSGLIALVAIFILVAFAKSILRDSVTRTKAVLDDKIIQLEKQQALESLRDDRLNTQDPYVTRGVVDDLSSLGVPAIHDTDPVKGPLGAKLAIIEYGDFECPFCAELAPILDEVLRLRPDIKLIWKDLPNPLHLRAKSASQAARCAQEQGSFWQYHDLLFANQASLSSSLYIQVAQTLDLDMIKFNTCLSEKTYQSLVIKSLDDLNFYEIDATPFLFIGSTRVNELTDLDSLLRIVDQELAS